MLERYTLTDEWIILPKTDDLIIIEDEEEAPFMGHIGSCETPLYLHSLGQIQLATCWFKVIEATSKMATSTQDLLHNTWLALYPSLSLSLK